MDNMKSFKINYTTVNLVRSTQTSEQRAGFAAALSGPFFLSWVVLLVWFFEAVLDEKSPEKFIFIYIFILLRLKFMFFTCESKKSNPYDLMLSFGKRSVRKWSLWMCWTYCSLLGNISAGDVFLSSFGESIINLCQCCVFLLCPAALNTTESKWNTLIQLKVSPSWL